MGTERGDSAVQKALERLCRDNGWSYGVFWRFDLRNSLLLTMEDAYYEEQMGVLIDNMLLQVHMLGTGVIGQAAFTKRHRWLFSDGQNPIGSMENQDIFKDDSEIYCQFSSGIETIAVISVEPRGVVQFGSTQKIPERMEFVDRTKGVFREIGCGATFTIPENMLSPSNSESNGLSGFFSNSRNYVGTTCSSTDLPRLSPFTSDHGMMNSSHFGNQLQMATTAAPLKSPNMSNTWSQEPLAHFTTYFSHPAAPSPCISTWSSGQSTLTSIEQHLPSRTRPLDDFTAAISESCPLDNCAPWTIPSPPQSNNTLAMEVSSSLNGAEVLGSVAVNHPSNSVQSSISNIFNPDGVESDLFESLGVDFECIQAEDFLDGILMPVESGGIMDFSADTSECISEQCVSPVVRQPETLFSKLGLEQFLDGIVSSSNSKASSSFDDDLSSGSKRKIISYSVSGDQVPLKSLPSSGGNTNCLHPPHYLDRSLNLEPKKEFMSKSGEASWIGDSYSITCGSKRKRPEESTKVVRKKARPGSRPKPKDRQQIQERIGELRKLIPNGVKMSIDSLLAQTIKHMLFLQSVTNHAEKLKQAEERKVNETGMRDNSGSSDFNAVWACEVGAQTAVDPVDVKDLRLPGQKLIQMLCEERGFFLEIVDIIQGLGLTILKGVMEVREDKIWACFIVEAEGKRHVTKQQIYFSLHQLLYQKATSEINVNNQLASVLNGGTTLLNNYHQPLLPLPISLAAETLN